MDARQVIALISKTEEQQMSVVELLDQLTLVETESEWTIERLHAVIDYSVHRGAAYAGISQTQGGKAVRLSASEGVAINAGPYKEIVEAISGSASNIEPIFSARNPKPYDVHILGPQSGHWSRPDLLVEFRRRASSSNPYEMHSIEFEFPGTAWPENVAQAYVSGKGAHRSWLLFSLEDYPKTQHAREEDFEWSATEEIARELGVGLIGYTKLSQASTWRRVLMARRRTVDRGRVKELRKLIEENKELEQSKAQTGT